MRARPPIPRILASGLALGAFWLTGCSTAERPAPPAAAPPRSLIESAVLREIRSDPAMAGARVRVRVDAAGVVTLVGTVNSPGQSDQAAREASHISGVTQIDNQLRIALPDS